jgi:hypothetical protein
VADHVVAGTGLPAESGFTAAFAMGAVALAVAFLVGTLIPGRRSQASAEADPARAPA